MRQIHDLSPTEFENLVFDIAIAKGMVNVVWRTPGADGGRDIEAETVEIDIAGARSFVRWYIECKRYAGSVDWPTIYPKIAYADAARAEYLLVCTTSKFTPQAVNNANSWNAARRLPKMRLWAGHDIAVRLDEHRDIGYRYGLVGDLERPGRSLVELSLALSKCVGTFYSSEAVSGVPVAPMLRAAFALSLLLQTRLEDGDAGQPYRHRSLVAVEELGVDIEIRGVPQEIDEPSFVAFVAYLRALSSRKLLVNFEEPRTYSLTGIDDPAGLLSRYRSVFASIALWGDFEFTFTDSKVKVKQR